MASNSKRRASTTTAETIQLRSAIRGRERWEVSTIRRKPDLAQALEQMLERRSGILQAHANPVSGRVLILYVPDTPDLHLASLIQSGLEEVTSRSLPQAVTDQTSSALSRVIQRALPERREVAIPALLSIVGNIIHVLQGLSFIEIVNAARKGERRLAFRVGLNLVLILADLFFRYYRAQAWRQLRHATQHQLRTELLTHIETQDLAFFDHYGTGRLMNLITEDTAAVGDFVELAGDEAIGVTLTVLASSIILFSASPWLALATVLPLPFLYVPSRLWGQRTTESYARRGEFSSHFSQMLENSLAGVTVVKSFTAERYETHRLCHLDARLNEVTLESTLLSSVQSELTEGIFSIGFALSVGFGGRLVAEGKVSTDAHIRSVYAFPQLLSALEGLGNVTSRYHSASSSAQRIVDVLETRPQVYSGPDRLPASGLRGEVVFENVSFGYDPSVKVLDNVSFQLQPGETLAIIGRTGSGKSTLIRLLLRFYDIDSGRILLDGKDIRELDLQELRRRISLVTQEVYLFQGTIRENVAYGQPLATEAQITDALQRADALDILDGLAEGLEAEVGERGNRLSGGQRQRIAIARALLKGAPILALDEATSQLDYETEYAVKQSVRNTTAERSTIIVSHRLPLVRDADQILVLERGSIREMGNHNELLDQEGLYASLWRLQSGEEPIG